jgi:ABC-2 type transport system ATP-binding protein
MTEAIRTERLSKRYRRLPALQDVDLQIQEGSVYALVGPNGAGKTTLIKILMNLIAASNGSASVLGVDSKHIRGRSYAQIGYVSENQEIPEWMRVGEMLDYLHSFYPTWDAQLEDSLLNQFDLPRDRKIKALSRGMKMKLALASALSFRPRLVVLDEPFGGLDPLVRDQLIIGLLERAPESTVFLSSHDLTEIQSFATHIGYLEGGRLRISEALNSLSARFRELELTFDREPQVPQSAPANWLQMKSAGNVIRFVETAFNEQTTYDQIRRTFVDVQNTSCRPMDLRSIFLAMARKAEAS